MFIPSMPSCDDDVVMRNKLQIPTILLQQNLLTIKCVLKGAKLELNLQELYCKISLQYNRNGKVASSTHSLEML